MEFTDKEGNICKLTFDTRFKGHEQWFICLYGSYFPIGSNLVRTYLRNKTEQEINEEKRIEKILDGII